MASSHISKKGPTAYAPKGEEEGRTARSSASDAPSVVTNTLEMTLKEARANANTQRRELCVSALIFVFRHPSIKIRRRFTNSSPPI